MIQKLQCIVPVGTLYAVAEQPDEVLVPDTADRFDLHLELLLSLAPDGKAGQEEMDIFIRVWGEKWNSDPVLEMCAVFKMSHGSRGESNADGHTERE